MWACETSIMIHIYGHLQGSLLKYLHCLNPQDVQHLKNMDKEMSRNAQTKKPLNKKYKTYEGPVHYRSGYQFEDNPPIHSFDDPDDPESSDDPDDPESSDDCQ